MQRFPAFTFSFLSMVLAFFAAGCGQAKMGIPTPHISPPLAIPANTRMEPIGFDGAVLALNRGQEIGALYSGKSEVSMNLCNFGSSATLNWSAGKAYLGGRDDQFAEAVYDALKGRGYNVVGDPRVVFKRQEELSRARFRLAARITDLKANVCNVHHWWDGRPLGRQHAEVYLKSEWSVFSTMADKVVMQVVTEGYHKRPDEIPEGFLLAVLDAFTASAEELAASPEFLKMVTQGRAIEAQAMAPAGEAVSLPRVELFDKPFAANPDRITNSVVTIRTGGGHGSGFVVSADGYILTNNHVVEGSERVTVRFRSGLELEGKVVKTHPLRDVGLVKVTVGNMQALPIRRVPVTVLEEVHAIGSPLDVKLSHTVTTGKVSAIRKSGEYSDRFMELIQADASIYGGNSGGPLVDGNGNVVGISVAGRVEQGSGAATNLNFFIPILDALDKLNIEIGG